MKKKITALLLTLAMLLALAVTASADEATPTRTENLNLSAYTEVTDMLDTEGWKYEPGQNGGTLTLRNFYLKGAHNAEGFSGLLTGEGTVTIVLEGANVIETTSDWYRPLMSSTSSNMDVSWIIKAGESGGSLSIRHCGTVNNKNNPYAFAGDDLTIQSGTVDSNMEFCNVEGDFRLEGGSLTVTVSDVIDDSYPVRTIGSEQGKSNVVISGGKLSIPCGDWAITAGSNRSGDIIMTGGEVNVASDQAALYAANIKLSGGHLIAVGQARATLFAVDTSDYTGTGVVIGSVNADGSDPTSYVADNYRTYKWIEFPHQHTFGDWDTVKKPTTKETGLKIRTCTECGYEEQQELPKRSNGGSGDSQTPQDTETKTGSVQSAKTADGMDLPLYLTLTVLAASGILLLRRRAV